MILMTLGNGTVWGWNLAMYKAASPIPVLSEDDTDTPTSMIDQVEEVTGKPWASQGAVESDNVDVTFDEIDWNRVNVENI